MSLCLRFTTLVTEMVWFGMYAFMSYLKSVFLSILTGCSESQLFTDYSLSDPLSLSAVEGDKARIKSSKIRQSLRLSSLGFIIFCLLRLVRRAGH